MKILKFGGTSVGTPERISKVIELLAARWKRGERFAVVFSAYEGVTNHLVRIADLAARGDNQYERELAALQERVIAALQTLVPAVDQSRTMVQLSIWLNELRDVLQGVSLIWELSPRCRDFIISFGELISAYTISQAMASAGVPARFVDTRRIVCTDSRFGRAAVDFAATEQLTRDELASTDTLAVLTGFIAATASGETTTLGRGGSDYTAAIVASAVGAEEIEIWTDVDGMLTADPRRVPHAFVLPQVTYEEALELCHFGAKVIYPPTLQPAMDKRIPIRILNTFKPEAPGTTILHGHVTHPFPVTGISSISRISILRLEGSGLIGISGIASRLFSALGREMINIILITQASSEHSICLAVSAEDAAAAARAIRDEFALELRSNLVKQPAVEENLSIVSIVGENMRRTPGISARFFDALGRNGVNVVAIAQGSSELNISAVIAAADESKAVIAVHDAFFLSEVRTVNLFIAGKGLIGATLLRQIDEHGAYLREHHGIRLRLLGLADSKKQLIEPDGVSAHQAGELVEARGRDGTITEFVDQLLRLNLANSIFVDCTASESVVEHYERILNSSVSIVTPNKKAQSASFERYKQLKATARKRNADLLFETSVGAGLPVISTLNDLLRSGDRIIRIEAILSGTLSFIFNTFCGASEEPAFSEVVREARARGYTEPDPRDDLNGLDAARKLLILAREGGAALELDDVVIEHILPAELFDAPDPESFMRRLPDIDRTMDERRSKARAHGAKLCFMGALDEDGQAVLSLQEVTAAHPFYGLAGSDNIIAFTTERYREQPLVVRGPGAGPDVTAAGVLADIVRIAGYRK